MLINSDDRLLFVGAHADDVELGCGGFLHRICRDGNIPVKVVVFSLHRPHYDGDSIRSEMEKSMGILGVTDFSIYDYRGCNPENDFLNMRHEIYAILEELRESWRPSAVITHQSNDTNQDHNQLHEEVVRCFKKHTSIITFEFPNNSIDAMAPNIFVELSKENIKKKVEALLCYKTQFKAKTHNYMFGEYVEALAKVRAQAVMADWAEAFNVVRLKIPSTVEREQ